MVQSNLDRLDSCCKDGKVSLWNGTPRERAQQTEENPPVLFRWTPPPPLAARPQDTPPPKRNRWFFVGRETRYEFSRFPEKELQKPITMATGPIQDEAGEVLMEEQRDGGWSQEGDSEEFGGLDRKWLLWRDFLKEHAYLETWLRSTEQTLTCAGPAHITYVSAKEQLRRMERLRREAGPRLVQADSLAQRNRTLARLFRGAMRARLLALARSCGRRCEEVTAVLESVATRLKHFVADWEGFEAEREELSLWLAHLDLRLAEVDHLTGNTCEKLQQLQSFQECVCINAARLGDFLRRGEMLIQCCESSDAQRVEMELLDLLQRRSHVFDNIARTRTRLLSMRLVLEDHHLLSGAPDSGCPSESLCEEEGALDRSHLDVPAEPRPPQAQPSPADLPPPSPPPDELLLEWDPSVDVGRSVCQDDVDSSCFSAGAGRKRRSHLSFLSDISRPDREPESRWTGWPDHGHLPADVRWATSTPERREAEPVSFDSGRVRAWLGAQRPASSDEKTSCSRAVQTEGLRSDEDSCSDEDHVLLSGLGVSSSGDAHVSFVYLLLLFLLLAALLLLLACLCWKSVAQRHRAVMPFSFHLTLMYVNGPPPT